MESAGRKGIVTSQQGAARGVGMIVLLQILSGDMEGVACNTGMTFAQTVNFLKLLVVILCYQYYSSLLAGVAN